MKELRPIDTVLSDLRNVLTTILGEAPGFMRLARQTGVTPATDGMPYATLLLTGREKAGRPEQATLEGGTTVNKTLVHLLCDIQIFRRNAFGKAEFLDRALNEDFGMRQLRSVAIGYVQSSALDLTSAVTTTLWEERALLRATFSVYLATSYEDNVFEETPLVRLQVEDS